ncbi:MAG TPA: galactokinase [Candidatus Eisenbacteria bacterium]|nr:galactokinase [Candidatus Eisenbacteria bacterium]
MHDIFRARFGHEPAVVASAPGRVNLMGEHTDYNGGQVLPTAIPQRTTIALAPRRDRRAILHTALGDRSHAFGLGEETRRNAWSDYVEGCTWALGRGGFAIAGFEATIVSTVPAGSGLSSSAALEVGLLRALREAFALPLDDVALARLAHDAESIFVGARVGTMDQMAASLADERTALFLDSRTLAFERAAIPPSVELVVLDSGVRHAIAGGDYNARRAECEDAARRLGVSALCDLALADLDRLATLPTSLGRRVRHVVTEHARVRDAVTALRAGDAERLGQLFLASHASQRDDYQVSVPEVDCLVELGWEDPDVYGARLTGGGFGGAVVLLARPGTATRVAARVGAAYARAMGRTATALVPLTS